MTEAPPTPAPDPAAPQPERILARSGTGRMLTGVCAGLGRYTGMDPVLFRVGFAVLVLASGIGFLLYVAAFLLMRQPGGGPGYLEQWTGRMFDAETVLALMAAVFAFGLIINVLGGINKGTIVVGTLLAVVLLAAHARGVDLLTMARSMPGRAARMRGMRDADPTATFAQPPYSPGTAPYGVPTGAEAATATAPGGPSAPGEAPGEAPGGAPGGPAGEAPESGGYRRLSDLAREARAGTQRAGTQGFAAGEPFAPHGPYTMREPRPSATFPAPPVFTPAPPPKPPKVRRPRSFVGSLTFVLALIVGGIMVTLQRTGATSVGLPVIGGAVLVTIGVGLLVATWFGRGAALVAAGAIVSLVLIGGSTVNGIPKKIGSFVWHPVSTAQAGKDFSLGMGEGRLDLSDVVLTPGTRVTFNASVSIGQLTVIVPASARVEVHGYTRLGEVKIDHKVEDGTDVRFDRVMEPETTGTADAPTIELNVKAGIGDVEVRRAA
ncbi:PspC domain-containing protein [Microbispora sp. ATCC PTA-5024]|uniref:PspC domain-containing protein n=1 Tax=Microbispora sp. ATCC PTA-5024 TaxID=316330 RepID=UPI0003DBB132|nr:PspC domain-containing protein [Microbispora sp. ATCC PTA-5024]ETK33247.1 hypothetical protein MPTA5024_25570 [Microbispora sp. ATCC PTA-5024]